MNRHLRKRQVRSVPQAYRRAIVRLDAALEQNTPSDYAEKIRLMRLAAFSDVEALAQSGQIKIPE